MIDLNTRLVSAEELSRILGVPIQSTWQAARLGRIPSFRLGQLYRFDLDKVLAAMKQEPEEREAS